MPKTVATATITAAHDEDQAPREPARLDRLALCHVPLPVRSGQAMRDGGRAARQGSPCGTPYRGRMADTLPPCPECSSEFTYEMGALLVCPECAHEWPPSSATQDGGERVIRDAVGNVLADGDTVTW